MQPENLSAKPLQLMAVRHGDLFQDLRPPVGQRDERLPAVSRILPTREQAALHATLDQERGTVVADLQPVGHVSDSDDGIGGMTAEREEQEVLLWRDASRVSLSL